MIIYFLNISLFSYNIKIHENVLVYINHFNNQNYLTMSKVSVFDHGWIDLVFEGRNQSYGAYQLRKQDSKTTMLALITGIGVMVVLVSIPAIINRINPQPIDVEVTTHPYITPVDLSEPFKMPEVPKPKPVVEEPAAAAAQTNVPTVAFNQLVATSQPTTTAPTTVQLTTALPGTVTTPGTGTGISLNPGTAPIGSGTVSNGSETGGGTIETMVDVAPLYPGGLEKFYRDVANRFRIPEIENTTSVKVFVSFVVEPDGTLSNIRAREAGYGLSTEAIRVLKSLKAVWKPGMKGGKAVRTAYSLPIIVKVN